MVKGNGLGTGGRGGKETPLATASFRHNPELLQKQLQGLALGAANSLKSGNISSSDVTPGMNAVFKSLAERL